ncbi:MAG: hypothetical protein AB1631_07695 [Acidobacteriota bacterium]
MPTIEVPAQLSVEHLMDAVRKLSPDELREFSRQFNRWQEKNGDGEETESALLARVRANTRLSAADQRRFNLLRRKRRSETITESETQELMALWDRVEQMNATRLDALVKLARKRRTDVKTLMRKLGIKENRDVF